MSRRMLPAVSGRGRIRAQTPRMTKTCYGREHRHDQFFLFGSYGDHREPDDEFRHAEPLRQRRGAVRQEVRACEDQSEADDEE